MTVLADVIARVTESAYFTRLTDAYVAAKVNWRAWSVRNPFLVVSKFTALAASETRDLVAYLAAGQYLDTGEGAALHLTGKSQYQLDPNLPVFAVGRMLLSAVPTAASQAIAAGQIRVGTPGAAGPQSKIFFNTEGGTLVPGQTLLLTFQAEADGDTYNLPVGSPLDLKTSLAGASVSLPASGPPQSIGAGNASLLFFAKDTGVSVEAVNLGANEPLTVNGNLGTKKVTISLRTNGGGVAQSTAEEIRAKTKEAMTIGATNVGALLIECKNGGDGTGLFGVTASPVALPFFGSWLEVQGAPLEEDPDFKERCRTRWDTLGGGAGDGAPPSDAATPDALVFWGRAKPAGYATSPVRKIKVHSNLDGDTGLASGGVITVVIAGSAGALDAPDVAAVEQNYYNPRKFSWSSRLLVKSAQNLTVALTGTVNVLLGSRRTLDEARARVAAGLAAYQKTLDIAQPIYFQKVGARIEDSDVDAIRDVDLLNTGSVTPTWRQIIVFDLTALAFVYV